MVQPDRPEVAMKCSAEKMRFACGTTKERTRTHTHNIYYLLLHNRLTLPDLVKCFIAARTKLEKPRNFVSAITICLAKLYV